MGFPSFRLALAGTVMLAGPATAGQSSLPSAQQYPSVEGYLCTFAGKCDGMTSEETETRDAPETRGFRLARPAGDKPQAAAAMPTPRLAVAPQRAPRGYRERAYREGADQLNARETARITQVRPPAYGGSPYVAAQLPYLAAKPVAGRRADLLIGFELNSARISREGLVSAGVFAQSLLRPELTGKRFAIEGHTDLRGSRALNIELSQRRAQAVADFLASRGVARSRLVARGLGADAPLAGRSAADPENRRVEAELLP